MTSSPPPAGAASAAGSPRRRALVLGVAAAVLLFVLGGGAFLWWVSGSFGDGSPQQAAAEAPPAPIEPTIGTDVGPAGEEDSTNPSEARSTTGREAPAVERTTGRGGDVGHPRAHAGDHDGIPQSVRMAARAVTSADPQESAPASEEPPPDAGATAETGAAVAALPPLRFGRVKLVSEEGERERELNAILVLEVEGLKVVDDDGRTLLTEIAYSAITSADYSTSRRRILFGSSTRHYLNLHGPDGVTTLRLDKNNQQRILEAFQTRARKTVEMP